MKIINLRIHYFLLVFLLAIFSCSKKSEEVYVNGEPTLVFNASLFEQDEKVVNKASIVSPQSQQSTRAALVGDFKSIDGFSFEVDAEQTSINSTSGQIHPVSLDGGSDLKYAAGTRPLTAGYTYRILIYRSDNNQFFKSILAKSGESFAVEVPKGVDFKWYAYSYNDALDIPEPVNLVSPQIETDINRGLMFASGSVSVLQTPAGEYNAYPINIVFKHKVAQAKVKINASSLALVSNIMKIRVEFSEDNYFKKGKFSILENSITDIEVVPTRVVFDQVSSSNLYEKSFYTVDPSNLTQYRIDVKDLEVNFFLAGSGDGRIINLATYNPNNTPKFIFNYISPGIGQMLTSNSNFNYILNSRKVYHVSSTASYAYSLQSGPGWEMVRNLKNFGNLPESIVKMQPWNPQNPNLGVWQGGQMLANSSENFFQANSSSRLTTLRDNLNNPAIRPDILIIGYNQTTFPDGLVEAIVNYVNAGGVLVWFNEFDSRSVQALLNGIYDNPTPAMQAYGGTNAGSMYRLLNTDNDDRVLNGPFGDARGKLWGEDASTTHPVRNVPLNNSIIYSYGQAINRSSSGDRAQSPTMFKHRVKNFFYLGDGGLVSYNGGNSFTICPFDYDPVSGRPIPKLYGNAGNGYVRGSELAYNGVIAGNVVLWAAAIAEFNGIRPWKYD